MLTSSRADSADQPVMAFRKYVLLAAVAVLSVSACEADTDAVSDGLRPVVVGEESTDSSGAAPTSDASSSGEATAESLPSPEADALNSGDDQHAHAAEETQPGGAESSPPPPPPPSDSSNYTDITAFGTFHGTSSHTSTDTLEGGRTAITTEAHVAYSALRAFLGQPNVELEAIGQWAFVNRLTNNSEPYGQDLEGAGLYIAMQGAKVGWIRDDAFDPQILADIQRSAREGKTDAVMEMIQSYGHAGFGQYLEQNGLVDQFLGTLKMEPHYGGWMHGRMHGGLPIGNAATAHDVHHLTVLSHDQTQPFMNDTFDWPQWPALEVSESDVINYFQSMVLLSDPNGEGIV